MDELNQHECMATMTGLIGHMQRNNITPKIEQVSGSEAEHCLVFTLDLFTKMSFPLCLIQTDLSDTGDRNEWLHM